MAIRNDPDFNKIGDNAGILLFLACIATACSLQNIYLLKGVNLDDMLGKALEKRAEKG